MANNVTMIHGVHAILYAKDAKKARAFFRDVLEFPAIDAGEGWLIFALPPAEMGIHPVDDDGREYHVLYLMCDDVKATIAQLTKKGVACSPPRDMGWGIATQFTIPGGGTIGMYEPRHPRATVRPKASKKSPAKKAAKSGAKSTVRRKITKKR